MNLKKVLKVLSESVFIMAILIGFTTTGYETNVLAATYSNYDELSANEKENVDYSISSIDNGKDMTIFTIHGGSIATGMSDIVNALAKKGNYNYYLFEGIKEINNYSLHVTSTKFDEPKAVEQMKESKNNISFIGLKEESNFVYVGGQNKLLARIIKLHLQKEGFNVKDSSEIPKSFAGVKDTNIVNSGVEVGIGGAQIAIARGLRNELDSEPAKLELFVESIDEALSKTWPKIFKIVEDILKK